MKKSIIPFVVELNFLAPGITAYGGNPFDENGTPFRSRFISAHHYSLNIPDRQGHFTCLLPEYVEGTQVYGRVRFIPRYQDNGPVRGEISLWS